jgi:hypothetical protein
MLILLMMVLSSHRYIQARPGKWSVNIRARANGPVTEITRASIVAPMPDDEVWVFEAREQLRLVNIEGAVTILIFI